MLESIITKYSAYLDAEELLHVHALQSDEFFQMRLIELPMLVTANEHMPKFSIAVAFRGGIQETYLQFVERMAVLLRRLPHPVRMDRSEPDSLP
jgi:hypothetical protein